MEIHTEINISASAETVWKVLTDGAAYAEWNPVVPEIHGPVEVGGKLWLMMRGRSKTIKVTAEYMVVQPGRELRWVGPASKFLRPLVRGEHRFVIEPLAAGGVRLVHAERFGGLLGGLIGGLMVRELTEPYHKFNEALKRRAESMA